MGAEPVDTCGNLDDRVLRQVRDRPVVPSVHDERLAEIVRHRVDHAYGEVAVTASAFASRRLQLDGRLREPGLETGEGNRLRVLYVELCHRHVATCLLCRNDLV